MLKEIMLIKEVVYINILLFKEILIIDECINSNLKENLKEDYVKKIFYFKLKFTLSFFLEG